MKKVTLGIVAASLATAAAVSASNGFGTSGIFSSEGFGFNRDLGSFAGCQSSGQGFGGNTACNSNADSSNETTSGVSGSGDLNAGDFSQRERTGNYQRGAFGLWDHSTNGNADFLAIGSGNRGASSSNNFFGYQIQGQADYRNVTTTNGSNSVNTSSHFETPLPACATNIRALPAGAQRCSLEGGVCWVPSGATVYYGGNGCYATTVAPHDIPCTANRFGGTAPAAGEMACYSTQAKMVK